MSEGLSNSDYVLQPSECLYRPPNGPFGAGFTVRCAEQLSARLACLLLKSFHFVPTYHIATLESKTVHTVQPRC